MRSKDGKIMDEILTEIEAYYFLHERMPSTRELAQTLPSGLSHNTIARYLREMNDREMLTYSDGTIVTDKTSKMRTETVSVPILGSISCGIPITEEENVESYVKLPTELVGKGEFFLLKANGDSMTGAGINDGDLVLVRQQSSANDGEIAVALVDNEVTLKRLYRDEKNRKIILHPENETMQDIVVDGCEIQGVAVKVIKDLS